MTVRLGCIADDFTGATDLANNLVRPMTDASLVRVMQAQIDPGVPWCHAAVPGLHLALKSGNFGGADFFTRAFSLL
jgi:uncharacterized protein YgbK (DUF1537 family)